MGIFRQLLLEGTHKALQVLFPAILHMLLKNKEVSSQQKGQHGCA